MRKRTILRRLMIPAAILVAIPCAGLQASELRFANFPDVSGDSVVFAYRDSIWTAPVTGGTARLL